MTTPTQSTPFGVWPNAKAFYSNERPTAISSDLGKLLEYATGQHPEANNLFFATTWMSNPSINALESHCQWVPRLIGNAKKPLRDISQGQIDRYSAARRKASYKIPYYDDNKKVEVYDLDGVPAIETLEGCNVPVLVKYGYNDLPLLDVNGHMLYSNYEAALDDAIATEYSEPEVVEAHEVFPDGDAQAEPVVDSLDLILNVSIETAVALRDTFAAVMEGRKVTIQTSSSVS